MRRAALLPLLLVATPGRAAGPDIPLSAIGLPFAPEAPRPVAADHPLYHRVALDPIADLPGGIRFKIAPPFRIDAGLRDTLDRMNLLAPSDADARVRLTARWVASSPLNAPFMGDRLVRARIAYTLARIDTGQVLLDRTIEIAMDGKGAALDNGMGMYRAAVAANFASAAACLDKAAFGQAPQDCALKPLYSVTVERR